MNDSQKIKHLYWRAGFGFSPAAWQERRSWPLKQAVDELFAGTAQPTPLPEPNLPAIAEIRQMSRQDRQQFMQEQRKLVAQVNLDWLTRMANAASSSLIEKMALFWHGHFACTSNAGILAIRQLNTLREHALGNFRELLRAIARDPAMIRFLNNQQNRKNAPNENFARELMELFTLGRGNYSEQDVKEAARSFTGWSSNLRGGYIFRQRQHDFGPKTFMGQTGNFDGDDIIDIILEQPAVAPFICRKIYAYFVNEEIDEQRVTELAHVFQNTNYDIAAVMRHLLTAAWFYAAPNVGTQIKSPVVLLAGMARQLHASNLPLKGVIGVQRALGQLLFRPPNVAGWPGGRSWIDNSTLITRLQLARGFVAAADFDLRLPQDLEAQGRQKLKRLQATLDLAPLRSLYVSGNPSATRAALAQYLLPLPLPAPDSPSSTREPDLIALQLLSTPEYQLC